MFTQDGIGTINQVKS